MKEDCQFFDENGNTRGVHAVEHEVTEELPKALYVYDWDCNFYIYVQSHNDKNALPAYSRVPLRFFDLNR